MTRRRSSARVSIHVIMYLRYTIIALLLFNRRCCCYSGHCLEFLEKRDNVVLGPFCKTTCTWSPYSSQTAPQLGERSYSSNERTTIEINLSETCCYALIGCPLMSPSGSELRQRSFSVKKAKEQNETSKMVTSDRLLNTSSHSFGQVRKRSLRIQFVSC